MYDKIEKEIKRREIAETFCTGGFLDSEHALDALIGQLQEQKSPALAYFKQEFIDAVAPITKKLCVFFTSHFASYTRFHLQVLAYKAKGKKKSSVVLKTTTAASERVFR